MDDLILDNLLSLLYPPPYLIRSIPVTTVAIDVAFCSRTLNPQLHITLPTPCCARSPPSSIQFGCHIPCIYYVYTRFAIVHGLQCLTHIIIFPRWLLLFKWPSNHDSLYSINGRCITSIDVSKFKAFRLKNFKPQVRSRNCSPHSAIYCLSCVQLSRHIIPL
ncbi:hypothetical protein BDZ97DRAFT_847285 [Flammula alnicola]|nr:hypothetical protein BDZ97DRAFT_847285 [Flammula alnicola]